MGTGHPIAPGRAVARTGLRLCLAILAASLAVAAVAGCPSPRLPVVEGCTVGATACRNDTPHVCSSSGRFHAVGDLACSAVNAVCVEGVDGGVAHCAPVAIVADGGAP